MCGSHTHTMYGNMARKFAKVSNLPRQPIPSQYRFYLFLQNSYEKLRSCFFNSYLYHPYIKRGPRRDSKRRF